MSAINDHHDNRLRLSLDTSLGPAQTEGEGFARTEAEAGIHLPFNQVTNWPDGFQGDIVLGTYVATVGANPTNPERHKLQFGLSGGWRARFFGPPFAEMRMGTALSRNSLTWDQGSRLQDKISAIIKGELKLGVEYCPESSSSSFCVAPYVAPYYERTMISMVGGPSYQEQGVLIGVSIFASVPKPRQPTRLIPVPIPSTHRILVPVPHRYSVPYHYVPRRSPGTEPTKEVLSTEPQPSEETSGTEISPTLPFRTFYFGHNYSEIRWRLECNDPDDDEAGIALLDEMADFLRRHPSINIRLDGHVPETKDQPGQEARKRSLENASLVRDYLIRCHQIDGGRIIVKDDFISPFDSGHGFKNPKFADPSDWRNNRVEISIIEPG